MTRHVAITGATGFVGLALAERLRAAGDEVSALVRSTSARAAREELARLGCRLVEGDVTDPASLPGLVAGADAVVHSAAIIGYRRRLAIPMERVNVGGTRHVLAAVRAAGGPRLVHVSSIAAIGIARTPVELDEESGFGEAAALNAAYFDTKHAAEELVLAAAAGGLPACAVNPGAIYGPSRVPSNSSQIVARAASGRLRVAPTGGINVVPLATVVDGIVAALAHGRAGRRYVIGGENLSIPELVTRIAAAAGRELRPFTLPAAVGPPLRAVMNFLEPFVPDASWYTPDLCAAFGKWMWFSNRRMREELGVQPADLDAALVATIGQLRRDGRLR